MHCIRLFKIIALLSAMSTIHAATLEQPAVTIVPVADLIGFSVCKKYNISNSLSYYRALPLSKKEGENACPRLHQLLFNEQVTIVERYKDEVRITVPHVFFQLARDDKKHTSYWTHKRNIMPLSQLRSNGSAYIPEPIRFDQPDHTSPQEIVTLLMPHYDPITKKTYSAGTRFVRVNAPQKRHSLMVHALNMQTKKSAAIPLPEKHCLQKAALTAHDSQKQFVTVLQKWAHYNPGFIPYVWGGCSFTAPCQSKKFTALKRKMPDGTIEFYHWPHYKGSPFGGFDCTGMIARAAQLVGMPYFYKNTTTLARNMHTIKKGEPVEPGDLIWFSGHVIVVADIQKQTAIEARGYNHGFGKMHEIPLSKLFKGINSYKELTQAYFTKKELERLDSANKQIQTIRHFKILKMASIWPDHTRTATSSS